jgi:hypothetical protein
MAVQLPYKDSFAKPGDWAQGTHPDRSFAFAQGGYEISILKDSWAAWSYLTDYTLGDVRVDVDVSEAATAEGGGVGIVCRVQDTSGGGQAGYYTFVVGNGFYRIVKAVGDTNYWLGTYAQPNTYKTKGSNHLRAECVGNWFVLSLNGRKLLQAQDTSDNAYSTGGVGLWTETTKAGFKALFKNFSMDDASHEQFAEPQPVNAPPAMGKVAFQDDFSDSSTGWPTQTGDITVEYADSGGYHIRFTQANTSTLSMLPDQTFDNVTIQTDVTKNDGSDQGSTFGIVCRAQDESNYYRFIVGGDGAYGIIKTRDGYQTWLAYAQLQPSAIQPGNDTNHLRADCIGNKLTLYANGVRLAQVTDNDFKSGQVGLQAATSDSGMDLLFANFEVRQAR